MAVAVTFGAWFSQTLIGFVAAAIFGALVGDAVRKSIRKE